MPSLLCRCLILIASSISLAGCMFRDVREQQAELAKACEIAGSVTVSHANPEPVVVILLQRLEMRAAMDEWQLVDYFATSSGGRWRFVVGAGTYRTAAFEDANEDLVYQPGEAFVGADPARTIKCTSGERVADLALAIPEKSRPAQLTHDVDIEAMRGNAAAAGQARTLGQMTAVGEIVQLSDARFSEDNAQSSLWRPYDFIVSSRPGVYFLEEFDAKKIPVLFVHGINGSPANFEYLIQHLDRERFQPWVYSYPSGLYLAAIADHLDQTMSKLELRYGVRQFAVVAHSMGGLVSRGFLLRHAKHPGAKIPLFISISTPWAGHEAAEMGVKHAPVVIDVWRDMAPGSEYLRSIFSEPLQDSLTHDLIFTFARKRSSFGVSDDQSVTVASQLTPAAQRTATRTYGVNDTHVGVLKNEEVAALVNARLVGIMQPSP